MAMCAYYSVKMRRRGGHLIPNYSRIKIVVKDKQAALALADRKDFVRFCNALTPMGELIDQKIACGRGDWYV